MKHVLREMGYLTPSDIVTMAKTLNKSGALNIDSTSGLGKAIKREAALIKGLMRYESVVKGLRDFVKNSKMPIHVPGFNPPIPNLRDPKTVERLLKFAKKNKLKTL